MEMDWANQTRRPQQSAGLKRGAVSVWSRHCRALQDARRPTIKLSPAKLRGARPFARRLYVFGLTGRGKEKKT
jgi:hypothetical protein